MREAGRLAPSPGAVGGLQNDDFEALLEELRSRHGLDLTGYKRTSLWRRVHRRLLQLDVGTCAEYLEYLEKHPAEFSRLFATILINVTSFFRNLDSWRILAEQILPVIVANKSPDEPIRVWSAGCASGEEAFTIAMLWCERLGIAEYRRRVKIYATDLDDKALVEARLASFEAKQLEAVPVELRNRYFERAASRYVVRADVRRPIIFARHDIIHDAPISRVDLLLCRNTLIYLTPDTQKRVLARFHFGLNEQGFLFLGKAEMLLTRTSLLFPIDVKHRIFSKAPQHALRDHLWTMTQAGSMRKPAVTKSLRVTERVLAALPLAQLIVDLDGTLIFANERARHMFGLTGKVIRCQIRDLESCWAPFQLAPLMERARECRRLELPGERKLSGGQMQHLQLSMTPLTDQDDEPLGVSFVFEDRTDILRMRADMATTAERLTAASAKLLSSFDALTTAHEALRTTQQQVETAGQMLRVVAKARDGVSEKMMVAREELRVASRQLRERMEELTHVRSVLDVVSRPGG